MQLGYHLQAVLASIHNVNTQQLLLLCQHCWLLESFQRNFSSKKLAVKPEHVLETDLQIKKSLRLAKGSASFEAGFNVLEQMQA